jgi:adenine-specific DNA-methyltransferase
VAWRGGGGFRYYRLAPSLLEKDKWGNWVINTDYNAAMLAEALCKLEGFSYAPSDTVYWQHGHSTERDFVYVTTASLTHEQLQQLSDEVGTERSLLVLCTSLPRQGRCLPEPHREDSQAGAVALRVGARRLFLAGGKSSQGTA